jgi:Uma2 family endonuclease
MNVALRQPMTLEEFLAWEQRQELRREFDGFRPVAMTGGTAARSVIQRNLLMALGNRLRGKAWRSRSPSCTRTFPCPMPRPGNSPRPDRPITERKA